MKLFSVKDFISYNNPCFSCKQHVNFYFTVAPRTVSNPTTGYFSPIVSRDFTAVDLKITYSHSLTLKIHHKTNRFEANNIHELEDYLSKNQINLTLSCPKCQSKITSDKLVFDLTKKYVRGTKVVYESLRIKDKEKQYFLETFHELNGTTITVISNNNAFGDIFTIDTPALPLYKFKNKNNVIKKIKTYMLFS